MQKTINFSSIEKVEFILSGFDLIKSNPDKNYTQAKILSKLLELNYKTNSSALSRILSNKIDQLSQQHINKIYNGFVELLKIELCLQPHKNGNWILIENCTPQEIIIEEKDAPAKSIQFHTEGRLSTPQKVAFFSTARKEMIEFGLTLNTFTSYLDNRNPSEFRNPLIDLLKKGVKIKCFLLDSEWNGTKIYFDDRESIRKEKIKGIEKIKGSLRGLKIFYSEINDKSFSKNFEVYTYRHFPNNYFLAIDKDEKDAKKNPVGKVMASSYLFGERRAYCPVFEFNRADQPTLFIRYNDSLQRIIKGAKRVNLDEITD